MQIERVHFEEVFDVDTFGGNFSFRGRQRSHYGVRLRKGLIPRQGSTYAIAFGRAGDWSTVLGWRELGTPGVMLRYPTWSACFEAFDDIYMIGIAFIVAALLFGGPVLALAVLALVTGAAVLHILRTARLNRQVAAALAAA
ncbi:hypothetical protein B0920_07945 [Massilia sp. KIM]|uniref:hypothetical protein n=1 Tax=Massilia sp. KIM TaxID=1955422 RepID=UPI00098FA0CB|nr:hypothetical protein [Massilia sp. KIM]OON63314.1 hypothetical protein B0920_07945 [Massilia sp. KIM]